MDDQPIELADGLMVERFAGGTTLVYDHGRVHELNAVGARILEALDGRSVRGAARQVASEFGERIEVVELHVREYALALAKAGLAGGAQLPPADPTGLRWPSLPSPLRRPRTLPAAPPGAVETSAFSAFDHHFIVRSSDVALIRYLDELLAPFADGVVPQHAYDVERRDEWVVHLDGTRALTTPRLWLVLAWLLWHLTQQGIATVHDRLLLHAALLELDGRGLVLFGRMNSGKSTLAGALVERGWRYHSDEVVALEERNGSLSVSGFPRPLVVEVGSQPLLPGLRPPPSWRARFRRRHWHLPVAPSDRSPVPLAALVNPTVDAGRPGRLEVASPAAHCRLLWENTWNAASVESRGFALLAHASRSVPCARLHHGGLDDAESALRRLVRGDTAPNR